MILKIFKYFHAQMLSQMLCMQWNNSDYDKLLSSNNFLNVIKLISLYNTLGSITVSFST